MQARFYLPMWGRFASPDPARDQHFEQTQSWNIYSYCQNNPVTNVDPNGMQTVPHMMQTQLNEQYYASRARQGVSREQASRELAKMGAASSAATLTFGVALEGSAGAGLASAGRTLLGSIGSTATALKDKVGEMMTKAGDALGNLFSKGPQAAPALEQQAGNAQSPLTFSAHALERMAERGVSQEMVTNAVEKGVTYLDKLNNTFTHVVGTANGKILQVATSEQAGGNVVTTMIRSKFNDAVKLADGTNRFVRQ